MERLLVDGLVLALLRYDLTDLDGIILVLHLEGTDNSGQRLPYVLALNGVRTGHICLIL